MRVTQDRGDVYAETSFMVSSTCPQNITIRSLRTPPTQFCLGSTSPQAFGQYPRDFDINNSPANLLLLAHIAGLMDDHPYSKYIIEKLHT